jgi:hypothetical protein
VLDALRRCTGRGWPYRRPNGPTRAAPSIARTIIEGAQRMADDLRAAPLEPVAQALIGDARSRTCWDSAGVAGLDAVVTSPPYLNQVSYLEATRLELLFEDADATATELRDRFGSALLTSCTQQVTKDRAAASWDHLRETVPLLIDPVRRITRELERIRLETHRSKVYDRLIPCYLAEIVDVLRCQLTALAPGARAAWLVGDSAPYGIYVDTPALIAAAARNVGFEIDSSVKLRARGQRWTPGGRPSRDLCERVVVMIRPSGGWQLSLPGF